MIFTLRRGGRVSVTFQEQKHRNAFLVGDLSRLHENRSSPHQGVDEVSDLDGSWTDVLQDLAESLVDLPGGTVGRASQEDDWVYIEP